jgi:hypothetical protein
LEHPGLRGLFGMQVQFVVVNTIVRTYGLWTRALHLTKGLGRGNEGHDTVNAKEPFNIQDPSFLSETLTLGYL